MRHVMRLTFAAAFLSALLFAGSRTESPAADSLPAGVRRGIPPHVLGCYQKALQEPAWFSRPCGTTRNLPHLDVEDSIDLKPPTLTGKSNVTVNWSDFSIEFKGVGKEIDSQFLANAWSLQLNTNEFKGSGGDTDWVQFTDQHQANSEDALCIWNIDVTKGSYGHTCVNVPTVRNDLKAGDKPSLTGSIAENGQLTLTATLPWTKSPQTYAVVAPDTYGLRSRWSQASGNVLGMGTGSQATFTDTVTQTSLLASGCLPAPNRFSKCAGREHMQGNSYYALTGVTAETNNLADVKNSVGMIYYGTDTGALYTLRATAGSCYQKYIVGGGPCPPGTH